MYIKVCKNYMCGKCAKCKRHSKIIAQHEMQKFDLQLKLKRQYIITK